MQPWPDLEYATGYHTETNWQGVTCANYARQTSYSGRWDYCRKQDLNQHLHLTISYLICLAPIWYGVRSKMHQCQSIWCNVPRPGSQGRTHRAMFGYNTSNFQMALSRFASIRGWPEKIYSDPGSQLVGVERELKEVWKKIDRKSLQRISA